MACSDSLLGRAVRTGLPGRGRRPELERAAHRARASAQGRRWAAPRPGVFAGAMFIGRALGQRLGARFTDRALLSGGALVAAHRGGHACPRAAARSWHWSELALAGAGISTVAPALFARAGRMTDPAGPRRRHCARYLLGLFGFVFGPALVGIVAELTDLRMAIAVLAGSRSLMAVSGAYVMRGGDRGRDVRGGRGASENRPSLSWSQQNR